MAKKRSSKKKPAKGSRGGGMRISTATDRRGNMTAYTSYGNSTD